MQKVEKKTMYNICIIDSKGGIPVEIAKIWSLCKRNHVSVASLYGIYH